MRTAFQVGVSILVLLVLLLAGCRLGSDVSEHVELVSNFDSLGPAATFELRFDQPMVRAGQMGTPTTNSPLVITPSVPGSFTWLSQRSGTFTPAEPLALGTRYQLALAPGLRTTDGKPAKARMDKTLRTPPFSLVGVLPAQGSTNASAKPEVKLILNAGIQAAVANHFIEFRDSRGRRVPADVRQGTLEERPAGYEFDGTVSLRTWKEQFADRQPSRKPTSRRLDEPGLDMTNAVPNFLMVSPRHPLALGKGWELLIKAGLPAAEGGLRLPEPKAVRIGDVTAFTFVGGTAHNAISHLPSISLEFSKALARSLTNRLAQWMDIAPRPTDLATELRGTALILQGSFKSDTNYTVTIRAGLPAEEPFTLAETQVVKVAVPQVEPRLYFPAFSSDQLAKGNRTFQLLAINVPKLRLRAKLLDSQTAIHALRGYGSYFRGWRERQSSDEPFRRVDYNMVPGRTVFNEQVPGGLQTDAATNLIFSWDEILTGRNTAVVFLEAERVAEGMNGEERLGTQAVIQLTDLGVIWKNAPAELEAFVFSHSTGQPVSGAAVRLLSDESEPLCQATTSGDGMVQMPAHTNAQWLAVQLGEDFHALEIREHRVPLYSFHLPAADLSEGNDPRRVLLFSDRELYRPGETMQFKAVVRDWTDRGLTIPANLTGTLVCSDAHERRFFETNVDFSMAGSCAAAVPINCESRGSYRSVLHLGKQEYAYVFQVQDFRPSAFEVALHAKPAYGPGEKIGVPLSARYYFGKPLSRARVKWSLEAEDTEFRADAFAGFAFTRARFESRFGRGPSSLALTGEGELAGATNFVIAPELPLNAAAPQPRAVSLFVEVTDINQQTLSQRAEFVQHSSEFYLGLKQAGDVPRAGHELPLEIVAVGRDGKPWPDPVAAQVKLQRIEWQSVRIQGAGRSVRFRNEAVFTNVAERGVEVLPMALPSKEGESISGTSIGGLAPRQAGQYLVEASTTDPGGHPVVSSLEFTVSAQEQLAWDYRNDVQMSLKPSRAVYAPGETAEILVETPISGVALVTVERQKVLRSFTALLEGNAPVIRVPIQPGDVPNLFVSVTLVRGSEACPRQVKEPEYRVGYCQLAVRDPQHHLVVNVSSPATNYLPAQPVILTVGVSDSRGVAANDAEVTLYAVDEGILSLSGSEAPDPYAFFYAPLPLAVEFHISLPNLLEEDPGELRFGNKGYLGGGGGAERLRKNFLACAFWNASLRADADGRVQVAFPAPDSLTRYRVIAVAHTRESYFGHAQTTFQVSKPLVVEPALPRFASVADRLQARAVVLNQTAHSGEVEVTLQLDDRAKPTGPDPTLLTRRVSVAANSSASVEFPVEFVEAGVAKWIWKGRFADELPGSYVDAVQSTLGVGYPAPLLREILLDKAASAEVDLLGRANPQLLAGNGTITVELANTRLIGLSESVSRLLHYPYGCAEQTSSSLLPWIVLPHQSHWSSLLLRGTNDSEKAIRIGIARLFSMQTQSGGLGYWPTDHEPMFWASAYGGLVLALAQRHGVQLPKEDLDRLLNYLGTQLRSDTSPPAPDDDLCLAAYALAVAGRAEPAYHEKLFGRREQLGLEGRALLALAISESQGPREMANELLAPAASGRRSKEDRFGSPSRQKAIWLLASVCVRPGDANIDTLVTDLMNEQQEGQWTTTQGNAWATLALAEYGQRIEGTLEPCEGELRWGKEAVPFRLEGTNNVLTHAFPLGKVAASAALKLISTKGQVFASTTIAARPLVAQQPRQDKGFDLQRRYQPLNNENQVEDLKSLRVGDRVLVTLRLNVGKPARFVAVDDALPSNLEAINPAFKTQQTREGPVLTPPGSEEGDYWSGDFQEIRDDRVLFFANEVTPGGYVLRYVARVRAAATAIAPAAKVEEMYHPDRYGLTETQVLSSQPME